jgi:hypothetical protein
MKKWYCSSVLGSLCFQPPDPAGLQLALPGLPSPCGRSGRAGWDLAAPSGQTWLSLLWLRAMPYLVSEDGEYITGQVIGINGGLYV